MQILYYPSNGYIINSLLDNDLYAFTQQMAIMQQFPDTQVEYKFKCRNIGIKFERHQLDRIKEEVKHLCKLRFESEELEYLSKLRFLKKSYIDFLRLFQLFEDNIDISLTADRELDITIKGNWMYTVMFETPVLSIINEIYFDEFTLKENIDKGREILNNKIKHIKNDIGNSFKFSDFGARRRYSRKWHEEVISTLTKELPNNFTGSSDVLMAMNNNIKPIGTMSHQFLECGQVLTRVRDSQKFMFQKWGEVFRGDLGIALTDTLGIDAFIKDFDPYFCKLFDGVRQDSGSPYEWIEKIIKMYEGYGIDPKTKLAVFSDGLDIDEANKILKAVNGRMKVMFGIGTSLTNSVGHIPLNIVIKVVTCDGMPVAKISDSEGKAMCKDETYLTYLKSQFGIK